MSIPLPRDVEDRITRARQSGLLKAFDYVVYDDATGVVVEIFCKVCGNPIKGPRPVGDPVEIAPAPRRERRFVQKMMAGAALGNYAEYTLELDDGTEHITHLSVDCGNRITSEMDNILEAIYAADLSELRNSFERSRLGQALVTRYFAVWGRKRPTGIRHTPTYGGT